MALIGHVTAPVASWWITWQRFPFSDSRLRGLQQCRYYKVLPQVSMGWLVRFVARGLCLVFKIVVFSSQIDNAQYNITLRLAIKQNSSSSSSSAATTLIPKSRHHHCRWISMTIICLTSMMLLTQYFHLNNWRRQRRLQQYGKWSRYTYFGRTNLSKVENQKLFRNFQKKSYHQRRHPLLWLAMVKTTAAAVVVERYSVE